MDRSDRRWIVHRGKEVLGYFVESTLPKIEEGCVAMELSDIDDGISEWHFDSERGWAMQQDEEDL